MLVGDGAVDAAEDALLGGVHHRPGRGAVDARILHQSKYVKESVGSHVIYSFKSCH